jgi:hypothetical protein
MLELKLGGSLPNSIPIPIPHLTFFFETEKPVKLSSEGGHTPGAAPHSQVISTPSQQRGQLVHIIIYYDDGPFGGYTSGGPTVGLLLTTIL